SKRQLQTVQGAKNVTTTSKNTGEQSTTIKTSSSSVLSAAGSAHNSTASPSKDEASTIQLCGAKSGPQAESTSSGNRQNH
ncbi:unnamed protein product, partial [Amoebophrya sp. A25]